MSADCIFCRISRGELPSCKVYDGKDVIAFMDIGPVSKGHTLVVPRLHCNPIDEVPEDVLKKVILVVQAVVRAQVKGLGAQGVNVTQANGALAGQCVPHIHFHVIPRFENDGMARNWIPGTYEKQSEMQSYATKISAAMPPVNV